MNIHLCLDRQNILAIAIQHICVEKTVDEYLSFSSSLVRYIFYSFLELHLHVNAPRKLTVIINKIVG